MRTAVIVNVNSRGARRLVNQVAADFRERPGRFDVVQFIVVRNLNRLPLALKRLRSIPDLECVIVGSGDGTIVAVLNAMRDREVKFGFLPLGTVNAFVRSIGLPGNYEEALEILQHGQSRMVALGEVNGVLFANIAAIGISSAVADTISDRTKQLLGPLAYGVTSIRELFSHKAFECTVDFGDKKKTFKTHQLVVANGKYHGYQVIGEDASAFKDKLLLVVFGNKPKRRHYIVSTLLFFLNKHEEHAHTELIPFSSATITTTPKRKIEADGEVIGNTPAQFQAKPRAIRVLTGK